jgi:molecular chaperone GrpE
MSDHKQPHQEEISLEEQVLLLNTQLQAANEREKRVLADYQNLQRRAQEERLSYIKLANREFCQGLLEPLEHLSLAAKSLQDKGLNMVVEQFFKKLQEMGVETIDPQGQKFDVATMEVVDQRGEGETVLEVLRKGYSLHGEVIQHAQVILGSEQKS